MRPLSRPDAPISGRLLPCATTGLPELDNAVLHTALRRVVCVEGCRRAADALEYLFAAGAPLEGLLGGERNSGPAQRGANALSRARATQRERGVHVVGARGGSADALSPRIVTFELSGARWKG